MNALIYQLCQWPRGYRFLPPKGFFDILEAPLVDLIKRATLAISPTYSEHRRTEILSFLQGNHPLDDETFVMRMQARTRPYRNIEWELFKEGVCSPLLKCLSRIEGQELMKDIHSGICGANIGSRALLGKYSNKVSIGRRQLQMQQNWFRSVTIAKDVQETRNRVRR